VVNNERLEICVSMFIRPDDGALQEGQLTGDLRATQGQTAARAVKVTLARCHGYLNVESNRSKRGRALSGSHHTIERNCRSRLAGERLPCYSWPA
jgi:hypothetical protein